jgi:hypothetical protein
MLTAMTMLAKRDSLFMYPFSFSFSWTQPMSGWECRAARLRLRRLPQPALERVQM